MDHRATWEWLSAGMRSEGLLRELLDEQLLTPDEITQLTPLLIDAGVLTSRDFIGSAVYLLLRNFEVVNDVSRNPALVGTLVDEILRLEPPAFMLQRRALADVILEDVSIRAGELVRVSLAAANRDPSKFPDAHRLRLDRVGPRHLSFGAGPHFCLGTHLGRLEAESIVSALLPILPELCSERPLADATFTGLPGMRLLSALPLVFCAHR
jgi:cytochrome P450